MATFLLDTNVLIALVWSQHAHHQRAREWLRSLQPEDFWGTCPITQCAFIRILSNPRAIGASISPQEAIEKLQLATSHPQHVFRPDDVSPAAGKYFSQLPIRGHQQITDAYLVSLCLERGEKLVTMDAGVTSLLEHAAHSVIVLLR